MFDLAMCLCLVWSCDHFCYKDSHKCWCKEGMSMSLTMDKQVWAC